MVTVPAITAKFWLCQPQQSWAGAYPFRFSHAAWGDLREWNILTHPQGEAHVQPRKWSLLGMVRDSSTFNAGKIFRDF